MNREDIKKYADYLYHAEESKKDVIRFTAAYPNLTAEDGYEIQNELIKRKMDKGTRKIGLKIGLTSRVKMVQMNIHIPIYGHLLNDMRIEDGEDLSVSELIHPRVESEIAFIMGKDLYGEDLAVADVMGAVDSVVCAMEILDSRYTNFDFRLPDTVADNASSSRFIMGSKLVDPTDIQLENLNVTLAINGERVGKGFGSAVMGHPANSVAMLAGILAKQGEKIEAGQIILTGGITKAIPFKSGDVVETTIDILGGVSFQAVC